MCISLRLEMFLVEFVLCVPCVVSVSCGQELEELLLEASLETGRDAP